MKISELYKIFSQHSLITTDSRNCPDGSLFFALKGDSFDGNDYIETALSNGAAYAVGDRKDLSSDNRIIQVDDSLKTLQDLANYHRKQINPIVIAITGTNGKTTTKELTSAVLSSHFQIVCTQGNLNNHIGVPLTLLQLKEGDEMVVIEMGANHQGEIHTLCEIADPDFGLITNVGKAHLEGFGSFEGIIRTKIEMYEYLRKKEGKVFANADNPILSSYFSSLDVITFGRSESNFVRGRVSVESPFLEVEWLKEKGNRQKTSSHLIGNYNAENIFAAVTIGTYFGVPAEKINYSINNYIPDNNRSQYIQSGKNELIADAYNANPSSMQMALTNFFQINGDRKMVILGEMKELGDYSEKEHREIIRFLKENPIDKVCLVGAGFAVEELPSGWRLFSEIDELANYLQQYPIEGYHILVKGSRSNKLENIISFL